MCIVCLKQYDEIRMDHLCIQEGSISCEYCSQSFSTTKPLLDHLESVHSERKMYKCLKCSKFFPMEFLKDIHERSHNTTTEQLIIRHPKNYDCKLVEMNLFK